MARLSLKHADMNVLGRYSVRPRQPVAELRPLREPSAVARDGEDERGLDGQ